VVTCILFFWGRSSNCRGELIFRAIWTRWDIIF
jgi:hypothetical protein